MPKLLAINNYYYHRGGAETVFLEHMRMFENGGWEVAPFAMQHPKNLESPWSEYFVDEVEFGQQYSLREKLTRIPKVIYSLEARVKLAALLERFRPDVCHAHNIYHHISPSILGLLKQQRVPTVLTLHDLKIACPAYNMLSPSGICEKCRGGRLYNVVANRCIKGSVALSAIVMIEAVLHGLIGSYRRCVSRFVVPSQFYIDKFVEWGMPRSLFSHVPNFVDGERFHPCYQPGDAFVYFGRLSREKGLATLIRAAARANCRLAIVGTGPDLESLRALAVDLRADVSFLGYLTGPPLHAVIRDARAVVLPSEWYENAPMTVLESYALGKPVIGARIGGIPELLRERETGVSFDSGDEASLADALTLISRLPDDEIAEMGRRGRLWVETEFAAHVYQDRMLEIYRDIGVDVRAGIREAQRTIP